MWSTCQMGMEMELVRPNPLVNNPANSIGGSSVLQVTQPGSSSCELSNSANHTAQSFSFNASGLLAQCSTSFNLDWDYSADNAPYNVSIVPLDQSFRPFTVRMSNRSQGNINWIINLQAGINFTIMFK